MFRGLVDFVVRAGRARGYDLALISGTLRQEKLYRHLGFVPFGPKVGTEDAPFQPMYITFEGFQESSAPSFSPKGEPFSFLPGPVPLSPEVRAAFERLPVYHRDARFREEFHRTKERLCRLVGAPRVEVLLGSGTLSNDVVAGQISLLDAPGIVISNGEFGERLIDHARRMRLVHGAVQFEWGEPIDLARVGQAITQSGARWLWAVVSETSTGMLNDLDALRALARARGVLLCLDCVSAIGAVPVNLDGVYLASGASGKAIASLPGLSFVFHAHDVAAEPTRLPRYLDLGFYAEKGGIPFTHSSNLIAALDAALMRFDSSEPFEQMAALSAWLRPKLARARAADSGRRRVGHPGGRDDRPPRHGQRDHARRRPAARRPPRRLSERVSCPPQLVPDWADGVLPASSTSSRSSPHCTAGSRPTSPTSCARPRQPRR